MDTIAHQPANSFKQILLSGIVWRACNVLFAFIFNALLVRQIGADVSSSFFYLLNNLFFAVLLLSVSIESGISFYNARKEINVSYLFSLSIIWSIVGSIVFSIVILLIPFTTLQINHAPVFLTVYVFGAMLTTFLSAIYFTNHDSKTPNLVATVVTIVLILLLPKMPWINNSIPFNTYILLYLSSASVSGIVLVVMLLRRKLHFSLQVLKAKAFKPLLLFSVHSFILALLFSLLKRSDFWVVNKWCSPADAGNYFQASKVIQLILLLPSLASFSLYPLIVQSIKKNENNKESNDAEGKVMQLVVLYFYMALLLGFAVLIFGYWIFPFLYGPSFGKLYDVTLFLIPGLICFAATFPLTVFFSGKNQNITTIVFLSISIVVLLLSNLALTPGYGIYGAAISNSIANFVFFFLLLRKFYTQHKLPFSIKHLSKSFKINTVFKSLSALYE